MVWKYSEESRHSGFSGWYAGSEYSGGLFTSPSAWSTQFMDGELFLDLASGKTYEITANIIAKCTNNAPGLKWRYVYSGGTDLMSVLSVLADTASTATTGAAAGLQTSPKGSNRTTPVNATPTDRGLDTKGIIKTTSSGKFYFEWAQAAANSTTIKISNNSYILVREV